MKEEEEEKTWILHCIGERCSKAMDAGNEKVILKKK